MHFVRDRTHVIGMGSGGGDLTHGCHDLRLHAILALETGGEVADATTAIAGNVGNSSDAVEHVSAGEKEDGDEADGSPDVAALDDGQDIGPGDKAGCQAARQYHRGDDPLHPVDRPLDGGMGTVGQMAGDPCMDLFGALGTIGWC